MRCLQALHKLGVLQNDPEHQRVSSLQIGQAYLRYVD
jgi:hypothetical protein